MTNCFKLSVMDRQWAEGWSGFTLHIIIDTNRIITLYVQNMESVNVKLVVRIVTTGLQSVNSLRVGVPDLPMQSGRSDCLKLEEPKST